MIQLLFTVIFSEMAFILVLIFKNPFRKLVIMGMERVKRGQGPIVVKTVGGTVFIVLMSSVYSMVKIQKRWIEEGAVNPTDQILMAKHLLEATLLGSFLFLGLMIDRMHHYIRELQIRRKSMEAVKKQNRAFEDGKVEEIKAFEEEMTSLRSKLKQLEADLEEKRKEVNASEANAVALKKQSEGFLLEYNRLLGENQNLRSQLKALDSSLSRSSSKKNT
ncbi:hypothetical protein K2173_004533 [Erythroxylum novogranatense]|uniref:Endoplasmic reticulum transmembrane protein n=1 Tax=Erythroxylum novogranatense TaxID=1862640 RepID=A0AAV8T5Z3_9ROSI|nr:hypothetical protein K2173_004533 [Erythroxylum novogranatense]